MKELSREKYLSKEEIKLIRDYLLSRMLLAKEKGNTRGVRQYYLFEFMLNSGLRVSEVCNLQNKDLNLNSRTPTIKVINGKGGKNRIIYVQPKTKKLVDEYSNWKNTIGDTTHDDDHVFISERKKQYTPRAIQFILEDIRIALNIQSQCTPHSLRHSFAVYLYAENKDLRLVQKQLGHSNVQTTTIYADITPEEACKSMEDMFIALNS